MQELFIHLHAEDASWALRQGASGLPAEIQRGPLSAIPAVKDDTEVIVFVPASDVLLASAHLPRQSRQRLQRAAPYALEEQFIDDVESLHVALGEQDDEGNLHTAVVSHQRMQTWLEGLTQAGIRPAVMLPENLSLPRINGDWSALQRADGLVAVRSGRQSGFCCDRANLAALARRHAAELGSPVHAVSVTDCSQTAGQDGGLAEDFAAPVNVQACNGDALASLIEGYKREPAINLCQGPYRKAQQWLKGGRRWLPAAVLLGLWLVVSFTAVIIDYWQLRELDADYKDKIEQLYRQSFPEAKRVVNARVQMEQKLKALRGGAVDEEGFLELMAQVGTVLTKVKGMEIKNLSYKQGKIDMELQLTDLQQLDKLKQHLEALPAIEVDVQSATVKNNRLETRVRIGRQK
ncbi:type II secretion system protein GspL [Sulfuriflexus mobilis]|uniref:type II secretion system protein GspL n=1 Tax=Sulfuriflexus mobilis TaxID=1811807 RepID=UPI000F847C62|nr:type II secretion system protein GspL [Sulfuriflexus mobilis]